MKTTGEIKNMGSKKFNNNGRFVPTPVKAGDKVYIVAVPDCTSDDLLLLEMTVGTVTAHPESERSAACISGGSVDLSVGGPASALRKNMIPISGIYGRGADVMIYGWDLAAGSYVYRRAEDAISAYIRESAAFRERVEREKKESDEIRERREKAMFARWKKEEEEEKKREAERRNDLRECAAGLLFDLLQRGLL